MLNKLLSLAMIGGANGPTSIILMNTGSVGDLSNALTLLWQGMIGIFIVMIAISLIVWGLSKIFSNNKPEK